MGNLVASLAIAVALLMVVPGTSPRAEDVVPASRSELQLSFAPLVKRAAPAVVNVYVTRRVRSFTSPFGDSFFRQFFGEEPGLRNERMQNSLGSGVIVSADGLIVTNNHVIKGGGEAEIRIVLTDKRELDAKIVLRDEKTDIAILKIEGTSETFPALEIADSDMLEVGDIVLAIGNPFGVGQTVTSGIVSGLARTHVGKSDSQYFIQTDAAINPGNSGGALIDMDGRLVGINSAIYSRSGGSLGIGFAIPSNLVRPFVVSAITGEKVKRPWLGAGLQPMTREITDALGLSRVEGAFVAAVYPNGPAAAAGLEPKDVIIGIDGHTIEDPRALGYRLTTMGVGKKATVRYIRGGVEQETTLEVSEAPGIEAAEQRAISGPNPLDGTRVGAIPKELAKELGREDLVGSVIIMAVETGSIAQGFGMQPGDVIVRVNSARIESVDELEKVLGNPRRIWRLDIRRGNRLFQLALPG